MGVDVHGELGLRVVGELVIVLCTVSAVTLLLDYVTVQGRKYENETPPVRLT